MADSPPPSGSATMLRTPFMESPTYAALLEELELLNRALQLAKEDPAVFESGAVPIEAEHAVPLIERAIDAVGSRLTGLVFASIIVKNDEERSAAP